MKATHDALAVAMSHPPESGEFEDLHRPSVQRQTLYRLAGTGWN